MLLACMASVPCSPSRANAVQPNEIPVIAILIDSGQLVTESDRAGLNRLAADLPFASKFMICLLQSAWCGPSVTASDPKDRLSHIQDAIEKISQRARKADGLPRTEDVSRVLNGKVNQAFKDFWAELGPVAKQEGDRQVWIVIVSPTIYIDLDSDGPLDRHLHNSRVPDICFPDHIRPADIDPEARLRVVIAVPNSAAANSAYPDSGIDVLAKIISNRGQRRLEGIYQILLGCPTQTDNMHNWNGRLLPVDTSSSCVIQPDVRWSNGKPESLSCAPKTTAAVPAPLIDQFRNAPSTPGSPAPVVKNPAGPVDDVQGQPQKVTPPLNPDAPKIPPKIDGKIDRPSKGQLKGAIANLGPDASHPDPVPPRPPAPASTDPAIISPPARATQPDPSQSGLPAPVPQPADSGKPRRPGPDPASVTTTADASPPPVVTGTLVRRPLLLNDNAGPVVIEFVRSGDGLDVTIGLVGPRPGNGRAPGTSATNRLVINSRLGAGTYDIIVTPRQRDPSCTGGLSIRGALNVTGQVVTPVGIALDLEVSRCEQSMTAVVIGTLVIR
jgi:hypothetical protein